MVSDSVGIVIGSLMIQATFSALYGTAGGERVLNPPPASRLGLALLGLPRPQRLSV
jgi:hypothetical protein